MRITRTRPNAAVAKLGRSEKTLQIEGFGDGPAIHAAKSAMTAAITAYLTSHPGVSSIQVVAAERYGGYTVEQFSRNDLIN